MPFNSKPSGSPGGGSNPLTSKGDLFGHDGVNPIRFPAGPNGSVPVYDSTQPSGIQARYPIFGPIERRTYIHEDFLSGISTAGGAAGFLQTAAGTGAISLPAQRLDDLSAAGVISNSTGSTGANVRSSLFLGGHRQPLPDGTIYTGTSRFEAKCLIDNLPDASNLTNYMIGWGDGMVNSNLHGSGIYFYSDFNVSATNWIARCVNAGTATNQVTDFPLTANIWALFGILVTNNTSATFYARDRNVTMTPVTITTNLPAASLSWGVKVWRTAIGLAHTLFTDAFVYERLLTNAAGSLA